MLDSLHLQGPTAADIDAGCEFGVQAETNTFHNYSDDDELPTIEELLRSPLPKGSFTTTDPSPDIANHRADQMASKRSGSINHNKATSSENLGSPNNPVDLVRDDDPSDSKFQVDHDTLCVQSAAPDTNLSGSPKSSVNSSTWASPSNPGGWYDIDDFPKTAPRLPLAERGASPDNDAVNKGGRQGPEPEDQDNDENDRGDLQVNDVAATVAAEGLRDTMMDNGSGLAQRPRLLTANDPSASHDETESRRDDDSVRESDGKLDNRFDSDQENRLPSRKRKQPCSSSKSVTQKKRKFNLQHKFVRQPKPNSRPCCHSTESYTPLDRTSKVAALSSGEDRSPSVVPSPMPSTSQAVSSKMSSYHKDLSKSSGNTLPKLIEVTFRPHSLHCFSFTAVIREGGKERGVSFARLAQLIESTGHVGKIDDFTIKPIEQHSFLATGFNQHASSRRWPSGTAMSIVATSPTYEDARSSDAGSWGKDKQVHSSPRKHKPWSDLDRQRLLAYKKEGKHWDWIFQKFPGRTQPAIRTRWSIIRPRDD